MIKTSGFEDNIDEEGNTLKMAEGGSLNVLPDIPPRSEIRGSREIPPSEEHFEFTATELQQLMEQRPCNDANYVIDKHYGGISGICKRLCTFPDKGIPGTKIDIAARKNEFGSNVVPGHPSNTSTFSVIRGGTKCDVTISDIVVGDVCEVKKDDIVPADGIIIQCKNMKVDESELTGEVENVLKGEDNCPLLFSGSKIMQGRGTMVVVAVGNRAQKNITFMKS